MKKEPLFDLIQSLTMSEKRFFKIFSQRHIIGEVNQYLLMFDFIDKTPEVNNEILLKQSFVKNLSAEKNYLYRANSWGALSGKFLNTLSYGISFLNLEQEFSAFVGIDINRHNLAVGYSSHPYLGNSYRSSVELSF